MLNLREAAEQVGTSKSTIFRAIKSGKLSATRDEHGGVQIDPAELARAFPPAPPKPPKPERADSDFAGNHEMAVRSAGLEVETKLLREMLEEMRRDRDTWRTQAERLLLSAPVVVAAAAQAAPQQPSAAPMAAPRWWPWRWAG
jgi:excisionase family DNA binding protein